jgi:DNA primase
MLSIQGVDEVIVFFDGDEAGQNASKEVQEMAERVGLASRNVSLKDRDPGALPLQTVQKLKSKLYA